jgi:hypothetical protein
MLSLLKGVCATATDDRKFGKRLLSLEDPYRVVHCSWKSIFYPIFAAGEVAKNTRWKINTKVYPSV